MSEQYSSYASAAEMLCDEVKKVVMSLAESKQEAIQEIRLRSGKPLALTDGTATLFLEENGRVLYSAGEKVFCTAQRQVYDTFRRLCGYAVYSVENEIKNALAQINETNLSADEYLRLALQILNQ